MLSPLQDRPSNSAWSKLGDRAIFDYLATAVFARFTSDEQRRLLYTACLDRFTPEQAETMSGSPRRTLTTLTTWSRPSPLSLPLGRDDRNVQATRRNGNRWISLRPKRVVTTFPYTFRCPKLDVAGSNPVSRSKKTSKSDRLGRRLADFFVDAPLGARLSVARVG
jgi:hypothetical protein